MPRDPKESGLINAESRNRSWWPDVCCATEEQQLHAAVSSTYFDPDCVGNWEQHRECVEFRDT
jgi:hypothetical protein